MTDQQRPEDRIAELLQDIAKTYAPQSGDGSWVGRSHDLLPIARAMAEVVKRARATKPFTEEAASWYGTSGQRRLWDALSTLDSLGGEE